MSEIAAADANIGTPSTPVVEKTAEAAVLDKIYPAAAPADSSDKPTGEQTTNVKADNSDKPAEVEYKLVMPKDSLLDQDRLEQLVTYAKEKQLAPEFAQEILNREASVLQSYVEKQQEQVEAQIEDWKAQAINDKEIGGEEFKTNVELARRVVEKYGSSSFMKELTNTGFGNHPEVIRIFARLGKLMDSDKIVTPSATTSDKKPLEQLFYGTKN